MNLSEIGTAIVLQCLTAQLERIPTEKEMLGVCHYKQLKRIQEVFKEQSIDLQYVLNKVLIDVQYTVNMRSRAAQRQKKFRVITDKTKNSNALCNATDKIREDKIREDKNIYMEFVKLTVLEYEKLLEKFGDQGLKERIERLNNYIGSKGVKYKSHYHTILNWENKNKKGENNVHRKPTNADQTVNAVNSYLESIGQVGNFGQVGGGSDIEGNIPKRLSVGSMDTGN